MCTCVNISADGLLMRFERGLEIGDLVVFRMPIIGRTAAKVVWSLGGKTGVQFEKSISVEDYLPMIRAMGARGDVYKTPSGIGGRKEGGEGKRGAVGVDH